jgi:hypothetical protein
MEAININERVIAIQKADGIDVGPAWWDRNVTAAVGPAADWQTMFEAFTSAYERDFPKDAYGRRHPKDGIGAQNDREAH